ncbi:hypothetical protein SE17_28905, partial [Kouleothrix aurantiaca]
YIVPLFSLGRICPLGIPLGAGYEESLHVACRRSSVRRKDFAALYLHAIMCRSIIAPLVNGDSALEQHL